MFEIDLIYHSHIDIGYTDRQERITGYHADFICQAVDCALSPEQEQRPKEARFHFAAEGFWAVEQYLEKYGEEGKTRLLRAIRAGGVELTAGYLHLAELLDYRNLSHTLDYARRFAAENGLPPIRAAMSCDVNGFSWGFADALWEHGVRYLSTCINTHHGDSPFSKPQTPFWWESPQGNRILVWSGLPYHRGNALGLIPGFAPGGSPDVPGMRPEEAPYIPVDGPEYAYRKLTELRDVYQKEGYPYGFLPIMASGTTTDNSPVGDGHCGLIAAFNEAYGDEIRVRSCTLEEFFERLAGQAGDLPVCRGDWNDWWTDGAASTPGETRLFRNAQRTAALLELADPRQEAVSAQEREDLSNLLIRYAEHTWGHSASHSQPCGLLVSQLDFRKGDLAVQADILAGKACDKLARSLGEGEFTCRRPFRYRVVNPAREEKSGLASLPIDFWEEGYLDGKDLRVLDEAGNSYPWQRASTLRGSVLACPVTLAPGESRVLFLELRPGSGRPGEAAAQAPAPVPDAPDGPEAAQELPGVFENEWYRLSYGPEGVTSLFYKPAGEELLCGDGRLGEPVYQLFPGGVRSDAAGFGYSPRRKPAMEIHHAEAVSVRVAESGPVFVHLCVEYRIRGAARYAVHFQLCRQLKKIRMSVELAKDLVLDPEGMYVSLPFRCREGHWYLDKAGAYFRPGEQLPRGCCDYYPVLRGTVLSGRDCGVSVNTLDAPLVTVGGLKLWDYTREAQDSGPLYSWLTNNKWETNFRTHCAGCYEFRYVIEPAAGLRLPEAGPRYLEDNEHELLTVRM